MTEEIIIDCADCEFNKYPGECWANPISDYTGEVKSYKKCKEMDCYYKRLQIAESDIKRLEQENERLKEENYQLQKDCQICENFIDFIPCKPIRDMDYDLQKVINQRDKYYKTLQAIKAIAKDNLIGCFANKCDLASEILQIITKAEEK